MRILLVNPPHEAIGSRLAGEHLPPLGLLCVGGGLIDAGHEVSLLDADHGNMGVAQVAESIAARGADVVMLGHSGSTSAQPVINEITRRVRQARPGGRIVVGGVFPTFHWESVLRQNPQIDYIVCGEGERVAPELVGAIERGLPVDGVRGVAYMRGGVPARTPPAEVIGRLDDCRVAWELTAGYRYTYWGGRRAVVVQFSRGCPHQCTYCGQRLFWREYRHRDPQAFADEIEMLHRTRGVEVFNFADENPAADAAAWRAFLEALAAKKLPLVLVGSIRADSIVRDAGILHLYRRAGFERFLLGIENYDEATLRRIKKAGATSSDRMAIRLLREHGILSMATYVVGFREERVRDFWHSLKQLLSYDPDQVQLVYTTPHRWTPYFEEVRDREVVLSDQRKWDYKHQVIAMKGLHPALVILCVKLIELVMQARPKAIGRLLFRRDARLRRAMRWYTNIGRRVWFWELWQFFFVTKRAAGKITLSEFWDGPHHLVKKERNMTHAD